MIRRCSTTLLKWWSRGRSEKGARQNTDRRKGAAEKKGVSERKIGERKLESHSLASGEDGNPHNYWSTQRKNLLECLESSFMQTWPQNLGEWWSWSLKEWRNGRQRKGLILWEKTIGDHKDPPPTPCFENNHRWELGKRKGRRSDRMQRNFNKRPENEPSERSTVGCEAIFSEDKIPSLKE